MATLTFNLTWNGGQIGSSITLNLKQNASTAAILRRHTILYPIASTSMENVNDGIYYVDSNATGVASSKSENLQATVGNVGGEIVVSGDTSINAVITNGPILSGAGGKGVMNYLRP